MTAAAQNPFLEFRARYQDHAELFVREVLGFPSVEEQADGKDIYPWQREALAAYDRKSPRISIRSGHGVVPSLVVLMRRHMHELSANDAPSAISHNNLSS